MDAINHIELTLPPHQVKPALHILLLSIFFHRSLDTVEPETREVLETHIACAPSTAVEKEVSEKVDEFGKKYLAREDGQGRHGQTGSERGEIALIFTQKKSRKGWFGITEEVVPWEAHFITIHISPLQSASSSSSTPAVLTDALIRIASFCAERRYSVPVTAPGEADRVSHQIIISPPPPLDLFAPSPPSSSRSPPPASRGHITEGDSRARRSSSPGVRYDRDRDRGRIGERDKGEGGQGAMGYLEQAKDVLRATGARAGAVAGWTGKSRGG